MDIRYSVNKMDFQSYNTAGTRAEFLIQNLYSPECMRFAYSHSDRMAVSGCIPVHEAVPVEKGIDIWAVFGTRYFLERRELGIFNIGGAGRVTAGDKSFSLGHTDCLYVSMGTELVVFESLDEKNPAKFYMVSAPAHKACETKLITIKDAEKLSAGTAEAASKRTINKYIYPELVETCQLTMGMSVLEPGSVWHTMPAHLHARRTEVYTYFDIPEGNVVFHIMGEPDETRHIVVHNEEAVISPSWSVHTACGTSGFKYIWAMCGENKEFGDMDIVPTINLR